MTVHVRPFEGRDLESVLALFSRYYADRAGFVPRTAGYWAWRYEQRPGDRVRALVAEAPSRRIVGHGVTDAEWVVELAIAPELRSKRRKQVADALLEALERDAARRGYNELHLSYDGLDRETRHVVRRRGYVDRPAVQWNQDVMLVDIPGLLRQLLARHASTLEERGTLIRLDVQPESIRGLPYRELYIGHEIDDAVATSATRPADVTASVSVATLADVVLRRISPAEATRKHTSCSPRTGASDVEWLFSAIRAPLRWYVPPADVR